MKETFTGKKDSVINITLLHLPQKLFGCWKLSLGSRGPAPPAPADAPKCWRYPKTLCKEGSLRSSPVSTPATLLLFPSSSSSPLAAATGPQQHDEWVLGTPEGQPQKAKPSASSPNWDNGPSVLSCLCRSCKHSHHWGQAPRDITSAHGETWDEPRQLGKPLPQPILLPCTEQDPAWKC